MARPEHKPEGDPCKRCGLASERHRLRKRERTAYFRQYHYERDYPKLPRKRRNRPDKRKHRQRAHRDRLLIGLDGEGYTTKDGKHLYTYLCACTGERVVSELYNPKGLSTQSILEFLWALPKSALLVGFSLGYDRTKWFEDWPNHSIFQLMHPDNFPGKFGPKPARHDGWAVSLVSTRLTLRCDGEKGTRTVWDVWKFFQSSFVSALTKWNIGTEKERALIEKEKKRRGNFKGIGDREKAYCQLECKLLAQLMRELLDAHDAEGLRLNSYFGPGSTASLILKAHGDQRAAIPANLMHAVLCAYFGGRFELSRMGPVHASELFVYDIASAYPYAMTRIPCLLHGKWVRVSDIEKCGLATLVRFRVDSHKDANPAWGPLPHRMPDGNILFPTESAGGWAWIDELRAGMELHPGVTPLYAYTWKRDCICPNPFEKSIKDLYQRRLAWGKAARGIVLKLGLNSCYGKSAQRVGKGQHRCFVRAGLITSLTRAMLLRAVSLATDPWNVLELATDSIMSREPLMLEAPGLGGWERKPWEGGVFLMRPGLRFALAGDDNKQTAARGLGTSTLHKNREKVKAAWKRAPMSSVTLETPSFFHGAKLSIRAHQVDGLDEVSWDFVRDPKYGVWTQETRTINYAPQPKRPFVREDWTMGLWKLPQTDACLSEPYMGQLSELGESLEFMRAMEDDQPDINSLDML